MYFKIFRNKLKFKITIKLLKKIIILWPNMIFIKLTLIKAKYNYFEI